MDKKPYIMIVMPCWKRDLLFGMVVENLERFIGENADKVRIGVVFVFSPEDESLSAHLDIYKTACFEKDKVMYNNECLGEKLNAGIEAALAYEPDYIMNLGSDDLLHPALMDLYLPYMERKVSVFGVSKLFFYEKGGRCIHFGYYNNPHCVGAGRMIRTEVAKNVIEKMGGLYDDHIMRGMDYNSGHKMMMCGYKQTLIDSGEFPFVVDIKGDTNINDMNRIFSSKDRNHIKKMDVGILTNAFPLLRNFETTEALRAQSYTKENITT